MTHYRKLTTLLPFGNAITPGRVASGQQAGEHALIDIGEHLQVAHAGRLIHPVDGPVDRTQFGNLRPGGGDETPIGRTTVCGELWFEPGGCVDCIAYGI